MKPPTKKSRGRPVTGKAPRTDQVVFYVTEQDGEYLTGLADSLGFRSRSSLIAAIIERLCIGGFSGLSFVKLGYQFTALPSKNPTPPLDFMGALRPFPPLIGDEDEPSGAQIVPFLEGIKKQTRKENAVA